MFLFLKITHTCNSGSVGVAMGELHVFHELLPIHEEFLALGAVDGVGAPYESRMLRTTHLQLNTRVELLVVERPVRYHSTYPTI